MSAAERFLKRFVDASRRADALGPMGHDPDGFDAAAARLAPDFHAALEEDAVRAPAGPAFINPRAFATAACDGEGFILVADAAFRHWLESARSARAELGPAVRERAGVSFLVEDRGKFIAVAAAPLAKARGWPLAAEVRAALESGRAEIAVIARLPADPLAEGLARAAQTFGFTGLEARATAGLISGGDARAAAQLAKVSYETARDALKAAMRKAGARRQGELVSLCIAIESGEAPEAPVAPILRDLFGLTARQAEIARSVARGASRSDVARRLGVSENVVKSELKTVFAACLIDSAAGLGRIVAQIAALAALASAVAVDFPAAGHEGEPLRLLPRRARAGRIAFADHGPASGAPLLFLHSGTTGRHLPARYIATLQALGLRPITLDRPGYGLTGMVEGDYLDGAADDMAEILDQLGLARAHVVCRSGAIGVARFAQRHPERLDRAVLINPEPPAQFDTRYVGFLGGLKRLIHNHPETARALLRTLSRHAAPSNIVHVVRGAVRNSPADTATLDDPDFRAGFVRASQQAAMQEGVGMAALEHCVALAALAPGDVGCDDRFHLLCGAEDSLQATDDALAWWRAALPRARFALAPDAGRFLHAQRPDLIAAALKGASNGEA